MTETLHDIYHLGEKRVQQLQDAGYQTPEDLQAATEDDIRAIDGIGKTTAQRIITQFETESE
jgi:large subunit ribosomal protein L32e